MMEPSSQKEEAPKAPESPSRFHQMLKTVSKVFSPPHKEDGKRSTAKRSAADREAEEGSDLETDADVSTGTVGTSPANGMASTGTASSTDGSSSPEQAQDLAASLITSAIPSPAASPARRRTAKRAKRDSWIPATLFPWTSGGGGDDDDDDDDDDGGGDGNAETARAPRRDSSFVSVLFSPVLSLFHNPDEDMQAHADDAGGVAAPHTQTYTAGAQHTDAPTSANGKLPATGTARAPSRSSSAAGDGPLPIAAPADLRAANRPEYHDIDHLVGLSPDIVSFLQCPPRYFAMQETAPLLPRSAQQDRMTLVLDLDETLVHSMTTQVDDADLSFDINSDFGCVRVFTRIRPHAMDFLRRVSKRYEVVLFTASMQVYANALVDRLDPHDQYFHHRLFRQHCDHQFGIYLKNLTRLGRDIKRTMLVDNSPQVFAYQLSNGIPIVTWSHDRGDRCLADLADYLEDLADLNPSDVRPHVRRRFRLHEQLGRTFSPLGEGDARCPSPPMFDFFAHHHPAEQGLPDEEAVDPAVMPASPFARRATPRHALPRRSRVSDTTPSAPQEQKQPGRQNKQQQQQQRRREKHHLSKCENGVSGAASDGSNSGMRSPSRGRAAKNGGPVLSPPARRNGSAFNHVLSHPTAQAHADDDTGAKDATASTAATAASTGGHVAGAKKGDDAPGSEPYCPTPREVFVVKVNSPRGSPQKVSEEGPMLHSPRRSLRVKRQSRTRRNSHRSQPDTPTTTPATRRRLSRPTAYEAQL